MKARLIIDKNMNNLTQIKEFIDLIVTTPGIKTLNEDLGEVVIEGTKKDIDRAIHTAMNHATMYALRHATCEIIETQPLTEHLDSQTKIYGRRCETFYPILQRIAYEAFISWLKERPGTENIVKELQGEVARL